MMQDKTYVYIMSDSHTVRLLEWNWHGKIWGCIQKNLTMHNCQ